MYVSIRPDIKGLVYLNDQKMERERERRDSSLTASLSQNHPLPRVYIKVLTFILIIMQDKSRGVLTVHESKSHTNAEREREREPGNKAGVNVCNVILPV